MGGNSLNVMGWLVALVLGLVAGVSATCTTELNYLDPYRNTLQFSDAHTAVSPACDMTLAYGTPPVFFACNGRTVKMAGLGTYDDIVAKYSPYIHVGQYEAYTSILYKDGQFTIATGEKSRANMNVALGPPIAAVFNTSWVYLLTYTSDSDAGTSLEMAVKLMVLDQTTYYNSGYQNDAVASVRLFWDVVYHAESTSYDSYNSTNAPCYVGQGARYGLGYLPPSSPPTGSPCDPGVDRTVLEVVTVLYGAVIITLGILVVIALVLACRRPAYGKVSIHH